MTWPLHALALVRGAEGSQIFSRSGVEALIAIGARVGARVARASWEKVETGKKELLVDEDLIEQTVAECLALMKGPSCEMLPRRKTKHSLKTKCQVKDMFTIPHKAVAEVSKIGNL